MKNQKIGMKLHKDRDEILNFCKKFNRIHVFGNGVCANLMCRYLEEEGILIEDTIVSDGHRKEELFADKYKVYELSETKLSEDDGVIIALKREFQNEVYNVLLEYGVLSNCIYKQRIYFQSNGVGMSEFSLMDTFENMKGNYFKQYSELDRIGCEFKTDKSSQHHNYLDKYEFFLEDWRNAATTVLELGVFKGASIKMWAEYFKNATIYGVDIDEDCKKYEGGNVKIVIKDLGDEVSLEELSSLHPQIIIDDASHLWSHQIKALYHLLPKLESGGIYIMEDLGTSFYSYRNAGYDDACVSAYDFCSAVAEVVCSNEFLQTAQLKADLMPLKQEIEYLASQIEMITFIYESCIIIKK